MNINKKFIPLIITSAVAVLAVTANIITACTDVENLPEITYDDIPVSDNAHSEFQSAQENFNSVKERLDDVNDRLTGKQEEAEQYKNKIDQLDSSIEKLKAEQSDSAELIDRYDKCLKEAQRLSDQWSVYQDMNIEHVNANYDVNNLRANQNNSNIYSTIGDHTGLFGQVLSSSINTNIYNGFDKIIASVDTLTNTINEHFYTSDLLLSRIQSKISAAETLLNADLSGDQLLFEMDLFESAYYGMDNLFETERVELVHELCYSKVVVDASFFIYRMLLSNSNDNSDFLSDLKSTSEVLQSYIDAIAKSPDEFLSAEEQGEIIANSYQLIPMICDVMTDPTYVYKDVRLVEQRVSNGFGNVSDHLYQGIKTKTGSSYTFCLRQYERGSTTPNREYYYSPSGELLYGVENGDRVCLVNGNIVYSSDDFSAWSIVDSAENAYNKYNG